MVIKSSKNNGSNKQHLVAAVIMPLGASFKNGFGDFAATELTTELLMETTFSFVETTTESTTSKRH